MPRSAGQLYVRFHMPALSRDRVLRAMQSNSWDLTNKVLYDLCGKHSAHLETEAILAKVLLVGRAYAAAIERRKLRESENDDFYRDVVAPKLQQSDIDRWITEAKSAEPESPSALDVVVRIHGKTTALFCEISGMEKRSLASKYLHFHVPNLFYIYDSRAAQALREFSAILPRASNSAGVGDNEYRKFAEKCAYLRQECQRRFGLRLSPRQVDNLLLGVNEK